jgi:hypothetical protein
MQNAPEELVSAFKDFFEALYPLPSQFELNEGTENPTLYTDELIKLQKSPLYNSISAISRFEKAVTEIFKWLQRCIVWALDAVARVLGGREDESAVYIVLRNIRAIRPSRFAPQMGLGDSGGKGGNLRAQGGAAFPVTALGLSAYVHEEEELRVDGTAVYSVSFALPYSTVLLVPIVLVMVLWICCKSRSNSSDNLRSLSGDLSPRDTSLAQVDHNRSASSAMFQADSHDVANMDGITVPKLATAAVEKPTSANRHQAQGSSDDFLNTLWKQALYGSSSAPDEKQDEAVEVAESSWEDRDFLSDGDNKVRSDRRVSTDTIDTVSSLGMGGWEESLDEPIQSRKHTGSAPPGYSPVPEGGILKKDGNKDNTYRYEFYCLFCVLFLLIVLQKLGRNTLVGPARRAKRPLDCARKWQAISLELASFPEYLVNLVVTIRARNHDW